MRQSKRLLLGGSASVMVALVALLAFFLAGGFDGSATAGSADAADPAINQYSAKFLCGTIYSPATATATLAPGTYNTAVNIHNPNNFAVTIQKKAVVAVEENQPVPPPNYGLPGTRTTAEVLPPDSSMEVDCSDVASLTSNAQPTCAAAFNPPAGAVAGFCKGFVVVEAARVNVGATFPAQLDVVGILTVKEEDGLWKDYTFNITCSPTAPPGACQSNGQYGQPTGFTGLGLSRPVMWGYPYNLPTRPMPNCYTDTTAIATNYTTACPVYDADQIIRTALAIPIGATHVVVNVPNVAFSSDSRSVSLDYEFVSPKLINYPCWPKNTPTCP